MATITTGNPFYTAPLCIYVVWHPDFGEGARYFKALFSLLCRDTEEPFRRGIDISLFQRSEPVGNGLLPAPIAWEEADRNMVILLVDDFFITDEHWKQYIQAHVYVPEKKATILPVAFSRNAFGFTAAFKNPQFIRLFEITAPLQDEFAMRLHKLGVIVMQELIRMLQSNAYTPGSAAAPPRVKLFISHAKLDGEEMARNFMLYVRNSYPLDTFFDANDMPYGMDFPEHIKLELKNGIVVVFHTDHYASREWCMNEVLWAKRYMTPILVVDSIQKFEKRSFPYMGNGPVLRFKKRKNNFDSIIFEALCLALGNLYAQHQVSKSVQLYWQGSQAPLEMGNTPELVHYEGILKYMHDSGLADVYVIYPDPPLGYEENRLLNSIHKHVHFLTPLCLPAFETPL